MNERFEVIWAKASELESDPSWQGQTKFMEKFAELIVRECASMARVFHSHEYDFTGDLELHEFMLKHFGVKE